MKKIDVAIVGAGPAGLACALKLKKLGVDNLIIFERGSSLGGILNQCIHTGFGTTYFKEDLTGPEYAKRLIERIKKENIEYRLKTMVTELNSKKELTVTSSENGIEQFQAKAIVLATGCRERTRENLEIPGTRPAGIFTAGQAQELINIRNFRIGKNVIIQGSGDIGLIMARRLIIEGYNVIKVFERLPFLSGLIRNKVQCLDDFGLSIDFSSQICEIKGKDRVEGVWVEELDENLQPIPDTKKYYECDTVLFSVGLIPESELAKKAGVSLINNFNPFVNNMFETNIEGIFVCGNALHIHDLADNASFEGEKVADSVLSYLNDENNFRSQIKNHKPYKEKTPDQRFNKKFFSELKDKLVCVICPKGCILDGINFDCERGKTFFEKEKKDKKRRFTTTIYCNYKGINKRIPVVSEEEIDISLFNVIKAKLKEIKEIKNEKIIVKLAHDIYTFKATLI